MTSTTSFALAAGAIIFCFLITACDSEQPSQPSASTNIAIVSGSLSPNDLGIEASHLREMPNPKGEGTFVYVPQTRFNDVERYVIWLVIDAKAFPLNGATKNITPSLPWPREAPDDLWQRTGLDKFIATEAVEIVFG